MNQFLDSLKMLGGARLALTGVIGAIVLGGMFMISTGGGINPHAGYAPLYSGLTPQDGNKILSALDSMNVPYDVRSNGSQIFVPSEQVPTLKMKLASEGLPTGGSVGYEIFDQEKSLGSSNFVYNVNLVRALEGELSRTISTFSNVGTARVHIVLPKRELFSREQVEPSASVAIKVNAGSSLSPKEVEAIRYFVSSAVPGLKSSKVTIVDNRGKLLARGEYDPNNPEVGATSADEFKAAYEMRIRNTIEDLLEKSVGFGKVEAQVAAEIDFDREVTNTESFDPDGQVIRSVQNSEEKELSNEKSDAANVSVQNNLPQGAAGAGGDSGGTSSQVTKTQETTNYEITKTIKNHVKESGTVKKLSVAVLVDGIYTEEAPAEGAAEADADKVVKKKYSPRSDEELKKLEALVKSAIGFDEKRGDKIQVVNMQFSDDLTSEAIKESPFDFIKQELSGIIQTLVMGIVAILAILLVVKPLVGQVIEASVARSAQAGSEEQIALSAPAAAPQLTDQTGGGRKGAEEVEESLIDMEMVQGRVKASSMKKAGEVVERNPEESLNTIRKWMRQDQEA